MRISLLSGAYGNSGDSLIEFRSRCLLEHIFEDAEIRIFSRKKIKECYEDINSCDIIFFSGGPLYQRDISRNFDVDTAIAFTKPVKIIGGGWKGSSGSFTLPYKYHFYDKTYSLFKKLNAGYGLGCRDWYSVKTLKSNGLNNAIMTGCPAWYDLRYLHHLKVREANNDKRLICISDPANPDNTHLILPLISKVSEIYPDSRIVFVFHRGKNTPNLDSLKQAITNQGIAEIFLMNDGIKSFSIYDSCNLHIGFRVHAHIFNLSQRHKTILIEEDGRGAGVNEALGLPRLLSYNDELQIANNNLFKISQKIVSRKNEYLLSQLEEYCNMIEKTNQIYFENAFRLMEQYYSNMEKYIGVE